MNLLAPPLQHPLNPSVPDGNVTAMLEALAQRQFFKLIGGGSFTEADKIAAMAQSYAMAGVDCIDIAPDLVVIDAVSEAIRQLPGQSHQLPLDHPKAKKPVLMISLPLDPDPHFRKIELAEPACIRCGLCLPACPTEAITLPDMLEIAQSLCYGCGRCVPVCPTDALSMLPFQVESQIDAVLKHPAVQAVEIHTRFADPLMLTSFLSRWYTELQDKLLSLCFRPGDIPAPQLLDFCSVAQQFSALPILLQIDGAPMSGTDDPDASLAALEGAVLMRELAQNQPNFPSITISGGINRYTADWLKRPEYHFIAGVGMGTMARKAIWNVTGDRAHEKAREMVALFKHAERLKKP